MNGDESLQTVIARRSNVPQQKHFDRERCRERNWVERLINWLKRYRRVTRLSGLK